MCVSPYIKYDKIYVGEPLYEHNHKKESVYVYKTLIVICVSHHDTRNHLMKWFEAYHQGKKKYKKCLESALIAATDTTDQQ